MPHYQDTPGTLTSLLLGGSAGIHRPLLLQWGNPGRGGEGRPQAATLNDLSLPPLVSTSVRPQASMSWGSARKTGDDLILYKS